MIPDPQRARFNELTSRWCAGDIEAHETSELEALFGQFPELLEEFAEATRLNSMLAQQYRGEAFATKLLLASAAHEPSDNDPPMPREANAQATDTRRIVASRWALLAACVIFVAGLLGYGYLMSDRGAEQLAQNNLPAPVEIIQRIDCVFESERWGEMREHFQIGETLQIAEGLAMLQFGRGAKVSIEGPAELKILSDNSAFLNEGRISAVCPPSAHGFEINTPSGKIIDHGTEFGVLVASNGATETHVFDGEVEVIPSKGNKSFRLTTAMAARTRVNKKYVEIPNNPSLFIRVPERLALGALPKEGIAALNQLPRPKLWFDATIGVQVDNKDRVICWQNMGSAQVESNAWQVGPEHRPRFEPDAANGRPALHFNENQFLATTPLPLGNEVSVLVVAATQPRQKKDNNGQIINFNGPSILVLDVIDGPKLEGRVYAHGGKFKGNNQLPSPELLTHDQLFVGGCRYSVKEDLFQLFTNGELTIESPAAGAIAADSSRVIGAHRWRSQDFFRGSIAEVVVYDRLLSEDEYQLAMAALMEKYQIALPQGDADAS
ncbi:LamG-like jellyroll fold domain-containing protein [Bremerella sp. JC770]|uniref:LamG-like jellyroll fold domain-containing protein n=1 Tax=Bremerella sp. JC770 TaxID=3232137 RepID=UPI003458F5BE